MLKIINYFFQSILIYLFFFICRMLGLTLSRIIFSNLFFLFGPVFKSKKVIDTNFQIFSQNSSNFKKKQIIKNMWKNYGMTFIEYIFLDRLRKNNSHIEIEG